MKLVSRALIWVQCNDIILRRGKRVFDSGAACTHEEVRVHGSLGRASQQRDGAVLAREAIPR